ncbi:hypothetical protein V8E54_000546 [Elaphomyces granulatus]
MPILLRLEIHDLSLMRLVSSTSSFTTCPAWVWGRVLKRRTFDEWLNDLDCRLAAVTETCRLCSSSHERYRMLFVSQAKKPSVMKRSLHVATARSMGGIAPGIDQNKTAQQLVTLFRSLAMRNARRFQVPELSRVTDSLLEYQALCYFFDQYSIPKKPLCTPGHLKFIPPLYAVSRERRFVLSLMGRRCSSIQLLS